MLEPVNGRITTSIAVVEPYCDPAAEKVKEHRKLCFS